MTDTDMLVHLMDRRKFAEETGVTEHTVEGWIRRGHVKTVRVGKRSLIDLRTFGQEFTQLSAAGRSAAPARERGQVGRAGAQRPLGRPIPNLFPPAGEGRGE